MNRVRLLGPPTLASVVGLLAVTWAIVELVYFGGLAGIIRALIAAVIAWRLLGVAVYLDRGRLVARNVIGTERFPLDEVDVQPKVLDVRHDLPWIPPTTDADGVPTMPDDNNARIAKRYLIVHGEAVYNIDALLGMMPRHHERKALKLRQEILSARDGTD